MHGLCLSFIQMWRYQLATIFYLKLSDFFVKMIQF